MKLANCPQCRGKLAIREYVCKKCNLTLRGEFDESGFENLSPEQLNFVKLFIFVQGNIREMEKCLNISYPTVKSRLAEIIQRIGYDKERSTEFYDIFNDLEEGFINVDQAIDLIKQRRKTK